MKSPRALLLLLGAIIVGVFVSSRGFAQVPASPPRVTLRFLFLEEQGGPYFFRGVDGDRMLGATPYVISAPVILPAGERVRLYKDQPDPETKKSVRAEVLSVNAPPTAVSALVVVSARSRTEAGAGPAYETAFYNSDADAFPAGSLRVINLGRTNLAAKFGATQLTLAPRQVKVVRPSLDARNRARTYIGVPGAAGWQVIYDSITSLRPGHRMTGVLVYSPSGMRHTYRAADLAEMPPLGPGHFWLTYSDIPDAPPGP